MPAEPAAPGTVPITVVVLTKDEERNLPHCLASVAGWPARVFVVDSGSADRTVEIARAAGAEVVEHPFETHAKQWTWALETLPIATEWVLGLDADQRVTPELRAELARLLADPARLEGVDGLYVARRQVFRGTWIRHGGYYPKYLLKAFRRGRVATDPGDLIDHHFYPFGTTRKVSGDLVEANLKEDDLTFWMTKHLRYAEMLAKEELRRREDPRSWPIEGRLFGSPDERVVWLKRRWHRLPLYLRPFLYFGWRYVVRLGFLDGRQGLVFHFLQGCWYRFVIDAHVDDLRRGRR